MKLHYWKLGNGAWFVYDGRTFLKLYGGPASTAYCLDTRTIREFENQDARVLVLQ